MKEIYKERLSLLRKRFTRLKIDALVVQTEENRRYLSGFTGEDGQFDESAGTLMITKDTMILATDSRYERQAQIEAPEMEIYCYKQGVSEILPDLVKRLNIEKLGFEGHRLSCTQFRKIREKLKAETIDVELVETDHVVEKIRAVKDESEIDHIKSALSLAESVFKQVVSNIKPGLKEKEIAWRLEKGMREAGAEDISFPVIVASGPNSALPHAIPGDRRIREGEPILIDWGARLNGYCSDITRTVVLGEPVKPFQKVFDTVKEAQLRAIEAVKPGISPKVIDGIARQFIDEQGFKGKFGHGLGHGTGLAIHEYPRMSPFYEKPLEIGMISTMEPGIYIPEWGGIRLENMIVVRKDGAEMLNRLDMVESVEGITGS